MKADTVGWRHEGIDEIKELDHYEILSLQLEAVRN